MKRALATALLSIALVACQDSQAPTPPGEPTPFLAIVDGHNDPERSHFFFLAPIRPLHLQPPKTAPFNPNLAPAVEICELADATTCVPGDPISRLTMTDGQLLDRVFVLPRLEEYAALWRTRPLDLNPSKTYRIHVLVGTQVLGYADVDVVRTFRQLLAVDRSEYVPLLEDFILPIRFRIEEGALCQPPATSCTSQSVNLADDQPDQVVAPTGDLVTIPPQQAGGQPVAVTLTMQECADDIDVDLPTFGRCLTITADPPLTGALDPPAIISICNADFAVRDAMAAGALSAEQAALVTMHRQDDANIQALPHADDNCAEGPIGGASGGLRGFARAGWRVFTRTVVGAVAPRRLYASLVLLDRGGGGESPFFSDFQFALPAKMDYADPAQAARTGAPAAELPAAVKVTDARDNPVRGARVTFTVTAGAGSVGSSQHTVTTGADGVAQVTWTLDAAPTTNVVAAGGRGIATPGHNGPLGRDGEGDVVFDPFWPDFQAGPPIASTPAPLPSAPGPVVEFTARVIEPMLTLVKVVVNDNGGTAGPAHFTLSAAGPTPIAGPGGASSGPGFLAGTYVLGETGPAGYEAGGWSCEGGSQDGNTITLGWTGESATCTIQNDDIPPTLTLIKQVVTDNGGTSSPTDWTLSASGPTPIAGVGGVTSGRSFSAGTYNLSESGPTGYAASPWTCTGGSLSGSLLTLGLGESAVCTITNNDVPPTLTLVKQVTNDDGGTRVPADWTLSAAGPSPISGAGGATSGPTFRTGTYTLSETGPSGYDAGPWTCVGGAQAGNLITLGLGETAVCTIVNDDVAPSPARALLIVGADDSPPQAQLMATGRFTRVDFFDARTSTPSLATLADYDRVLAYTNFIAANPTALGDVLADYVDSGGGLVVSTYAFSTPWSIRGRITTSEYSPLLDVGQNGAVSGVLSPVVPGDPVFAGINLAALSYFHNSNFAHPGLVRGATLLATDGAGRNMIARNSAGTVIGVNLFPGVCCGGNNQEFFNLLANLIQSGR